MTEIHRVDTNNPKDVERFVRFPFYLYRDCRQWVPPLLSSARKQLNRERHPFYRHSDADFFLALQDGDQVVGRIAVLEPRRRNAYRGRQGAFFYLFESVEDVDVARALFSAAFDWARSRGMKEISGPDGLLPGDGLGILVKGFEHLPAMGISYNHPYYDALVKDSGFRKQTDYYSGYISGDYEMPKRFLRVAEKIKKRRGFRTLRFRNKDEIRALAPKIIEAYNAAFSENREFIPMTGEDAESIAERLISLTHPDLVKIVVKGDQIVGFALGFPNISSALQRCKGRLYPFGWALLLWESRRTRRVDLNGGGILPQYQGLGVSAVMYSEIYKIIKARAFLHADVVQVNEQNIRMMRDLKGLDVDFYKTHRIYQREL